MSKSIEQHADFAKRHPIFYVPPFLTGLALMGITLSQFALILPSLWLTVPLSIIGLVFEAACMIIAARFLVMLAKAEENKK